MGEFIVGKMLFSDMFWGSFEKEQKNGLPRFSRKRIATTQTQNKTRQTIPAYS